MKNIIKNTFIILGISSLAITSCKEDILTTIPNDRVSTEVYWRSDLDAKYAVNAIYSALDGTNLFVLDGITDIGHTNTVFTVEYNIENGTYDASHSRIQSEWQNLYRGIFLANYLLENVDQVKTASNTAIIDQYKSEARSLRAYFYMKLVALYGDIPLITKNLSPADGLKIARTKASDIWSFVDKELTEQYPSIQTVRFDIDSDVEYAKSFNIRGVPVLIAFKEGKEVGRKVGLISDKQILDFYSTL
jgi:hypothetical protein